MAGAWGARPPMRRTERITTLAAIVALALFASWRAAALAPPDDAIELIEPTTCEPFAPCTP